MCIAATFVQLGNHRRVFNPEPVCWTNLRLICWCRIGAAAVTGNWGMRNVTCVIVSLFVCGHGVAYPVFSTLVNSFRSIWPDQYILLWFVCEKNQCYIYIILRNFPQTHCCKHRIKISEREVSGTPLSGYRKKMAKKRWCAIALL